MVSTLTCNMLRLNNPRPCCSPRIASSRILRSSIRLQAAPATETEPAHTSPAASSSSLHASVTTSKTTTTANANASSSSGASFARLSSTSHKASVVATCVLLGFVAVEDSFPAIRLAILTYMVWAVGEWVVHRYFMHARAGSLADRLTHLNKLHVEHHADTRKDMTMKEPFSVDALYFHFPNTVVQVLAGTAILATLDVGLSLDIPLSWTLISSVTFALLHNLLWNTMHMDMHEVYDKITDGVPCVAYERSGPYVQWVFDNHTTHHDVGGGSNYNVVCPGPDFVFNTYMSRQRAVNLQAVGTANA